MKTTKFLAVLLSTLMLLWAFPFAVIGAYAGETETEATVGEGIWTTNRQADEYGAVMYRPAAGYHYDESGFVVDEADYTATNPFLNVETKEKVNVKDGLYMEIVVDRFSYTGPLENEDEWISFNLWSEPTLCPGQIGYGEGYLNLLRGNGNGRHTSIEHFLTSDVNGFYNRITGVVPTRLTADGKEVWAFEVGYDTWSGYYMKVNGTVVLQDSGYDLFLKQLAPDGYFYVGVSLHSTVKNGTAALTVTKYGNTVADAITPAGSDSKKAEINPWNMTWDPADQTTVPTDTPALMWDATKSSFVEDPRGSNLKFTAQSDNSYRVTATNRSNYFNWVIDPAHQYDGKDFPVLAMMVKGLHCNQGNVYYCAGDVVAPSAGYSTVFTQTAADSRLYIDANGDEYVLMFISMEGNWSGRIHQLRIAFDQIDISTADTMSFDILYMGLFRSQTEAVNYTDTRYEGTLIRDGSANSYYTVTYLDENGNVYRTLQFPKGITVFGDPEDHSVPVQAPVDKAQTCTDDVYINGVSVAHADTEIKAYRARPIVDRKGSITSIGFYGWSNIADIAAFGYEINGMQVWNGGEYEHNIAPDDGLQTALGSSDAYRHKILVPTTDLPSGVYNISILIKYTDGTVGHLEKWGTFRYVKGDNEPSVPVKAGYVGTWEPYTLGSDVEVRPVYTVLVGDSSITSVAMTLGQGIAFNYFVQLNEGHEMAYMRFTMNGEETVVQGTAMADGRYLFAFNGITPQCMGDTVTAELILDGTVLDTKADYSVKAYCMNLMSKTAVDLKLTDTKYATLEALLADTLAYGAQAQIYTGHKREMLVTDGLNIRPSDTLPTEKDNVMYLTESAKDDTAFTAAGVRFENFNRLFVAFDAASAGRVVIKLNGVETGHYDFSSGKGQVVYTAALRAHDFDEVFTFELYCGDTLVQTLIYSVNAYAARIANNTAEDGNTLTSMAELARAMYRYGRSSETYSNTP